LFKIFIARFSQDCQVVEFCNGTQLLHFCYSAGLEAHPDPGNFSAAATAINSVHPSFARRSFVRISTVANALFVGCFCFKNCFFIH
jgi:hypothetical protein